MSGRRPVPASFQTAWSTWRATLACGCATRLQGTPDLFGVWTDTDSLLWAADQVARSGLPGAWAARLWEGRAPEAARGGCWRGLFRDAKTTPEDRALVL